MKKDQIRWIIGSAVLLILFLLVAFLVPFVHTGAFWVSFAFTLVAFGVVAWAFYVAFVKNLDAKSRFYGFPIARLGVIYGIFQLVAGLAFMALGHWIPGWVVLIVSAVALGIAVLGLISAEAVVDEIQILDTKLKKDVSVMRTLQSKVGNLAAQCDNPAIRALADDFRYSDPVSGDNLAEAEADLSAAVDALQEAVVEGNSETVALLARKASALLAERNRLCKLNK